MQPQGVFFCELLFLLAVLYRICEYGDTEGDPMSLSQADRIRHKIEDDILTFRLKPGERLDESKLAEQYGTSRTPVREALRQLSSNGLIEIRPHKGAIVSKLSIRDLIELFEVMAELEGACGRLAAKASLTSDINAIAKLHEISRTYVEANDLESYAKAGADFHTAIYYASHNTCLIKMAVGVRNRIAPHRRLQLEQVNRLATSFQEHEKILNAIREGQPDLADKLLQNHILDKEAEIRRFLSIVADVDDDHTRGPSRSRRETAPQYHHTVSAK